MLLLTGYLFIILGLNLCSLLIKRRNIRLEKWITNIFYGMLIMQIFLFVLLLNDLQLKGKYTNYIFYFLFLVSTLQYYVMKKNNWIKYNLAFISSILLPVSLYTSYTTHSIVSFPIDNHYLIHVTHGGFLSAGEVLIVVKPECFIFERTKTTVNNLGLIGIKTIRTENFDGQKAKLLIYHDGQRDSENPYHYIFNFNNR